MQRKPPQARGWRNMMETAGSRNVEGLVHRSRDREPPMMSGTKGDNEQEEREGSTQDTGLLLNVPRSVKP